MKKLNALNKRVLIIPDMHCPYNHKDAIRFLAAVKEKYQPDLILNLGDEVDSHAISFHDSDADLYSAGEELEKAINQLDLLEELFPKMHILDSNHGSLAVRRFKKHGLPMKYMKSLQEIYGKPKWAWHDEILLSTKDGDVYLCHGKSATYGKLCKDVGASAIQGHFHGKCEVTWHKSVTKEIFNCFSGCLIDYKSLAFAYGKNHMPKPILACTVLSKTGYPTIIKMGLTKAGRWDKKIECPLK